MSSSNMSSSKIITFGEPERVLASSLIDNLGVFLNTWDGYYHPPIDKSGLSKMTRCNAHHGTCLIFRRNMISKFFYSNYVKKFDFKKAAFDYLVFGECYFRIHTNHFNTVTRLEHLPALNMRFVDSVNGVEKFIYLKPNNERIEFPRGSVIRAMEYDTHQQMYGIPDWIHGMQSALLNEDATLFRRKYFNNGCHLGYILYSNDPNLNDKELKSFEETIKSGKGIGNFKSAFINIPNGAEKAIQVIPVGDISQKDEFERVKNISAEDVIVAHRVRGELAALMPRERSNLSDIEKVSKIYVENEVMPFALNFESLNDHFTSIKPFQFKFD